MKPVPTDAFEGERVLVSGGSGFLGSWICDVLVLPGAKVVCLDILSTGLFENVDHLKAEKVFEFERAGVSSYVGRGKFDLVFHLASRRSPENYQKHPVETALANPSPFIPLFSLHQELDKTSFSPIFEAVLGVVCLFFRGF